MVDQVDVRAMDGSPFLDDGQRKSVAFIASQLPKNGVVLADEVGTGKTRIACFLLDAVLRAGGNAVTVVPRGLMGQWRSEFMLLRGKELRPRELTTWHEFISRADVTERPPAWWLVSHGFRFPTVRSQTPSWKFALPWLVLLAAEPERRDDGRTQLNRLWQEVNESRPDWAIAQRLAKRLPRDVLDRIRALPLPDWEYRTHEELAKMFMRAPTRGLGLEVIDRLLQQWVGRVDLLIVDEAHKSRDDEDAVPRTVLSQLLERTLKTDGDSRRLCMTATPMELSMDQWRPLLHRARADVLGERIERVMTEFRDAVGHAARAPDEATVIAELGRTGKTFEAALRPFVTRRRRTSDPIFARFRQALPQALGPRPHRNTKRVPIRWDVEVQEAGPEWRQVLIALEGISRAAKELPDVDAVKRLRTTLATGHALDLLDDHSIEEPSEADAPQLRRLKYWFTQYAAARRRQRRNAREVSLLGGGRDFDPDTEHPRILAAVNAIEAFCVGAPMRPPEKVLCFGVFLRPLRLLRDVLNVRHALRCVDRGEPSSATVRALSTVAVRNYHRVHAAGGYGGALAGPLLAPERLMEKLERAHTQYTRARERVGRRVDRQIDRELVEHGVELRDKRLLVTLREALHAEALQAEIDGDDAERWRLVLREAVGAREDDGSDDDIGPSRDSTSELVQWIEGEAESERDGRVRSGFCRLLQGSSGWSTRRTMQAAFRRKGSFPHVLLAQSQVGREGLNLHDDCRVVVQLHAEWNPAILEQQIGRVDRKGSRWEKLAEQWLAGGAQGDVPRIEVQQIVFDGTYDASQWDRVGRRQGLFDAALFGELLPLDAWLRATDEQRQALTEAAPDFSPRSGS